MARRIIDAGIVDVFVTLLNVHAASTDFTLESFRLIRLLSYSGLTAAPDNRKSETRWSLTIICSAVIRSWNLPLSARALLF